MKNIYIGTVTFSASEGPASSVAGGWSYSQERLERWLREQAHSAPRCINGDMHLVIDQVQPVFQVDVVREIID